MTSACSNRQLDQQVPPVRLCYKPIIRLFVVAVVMSCSGLLTSAQTVAAASSKLKHSLPAEISLTVAVETMPGLTDANSFWEGVYELRITDWNSVTPAALSDSEFGLVLTQLTSIKRSLVGKDERSVLISLPVEGELRKRLEAEENAPQAFLLRSTIGLFDAKLGRRYALKVNRVWQFKLFRDGKSRITLTIEPDGSYGVWGPFPDQLPDGYRLVGVPGSKIKEKKP